MVLYMHKIAQMHPSMRPESYAVVLDCQQKKKEKLEKEKKSFGSIRNMELLHNNKKSFLASGKQNCYRQHLLWSRWKEQQHFFNI